MPTPPDGTLKDLRPIGDNKVDQVIEQIRNTAQSSNFNTGTTVPGATDGSIGNIRIVNTGGLWYIYAKCDATTWRRVQIT